jgi:hypothetical protein
MYADPIITESKTNNSPAVPTTTSVNAKSTATTNLGWMSSLRDLPREHGFEPLRVEGTIPADLVGTLYRVGPSLFSSWCRAKVWSRNAVPATKSTAGTARRCPD